MKAHIEENRYLPGKSWGALPGACCKIGTRNTPNFELWKAIGLQALPGPAQLASQYLNESLNAAGILGVEGNANVIFCLRGMKNRTGQPTATWFGFAHVPRKTPDPQNAGV